MKQPVSARACRLGAIPFQECPRRGADANWGGEQTKTHWAALLLIRDYPAQDKEECHVEPESRESPQRRHQDQKDKSTKHHRLHERDLQREKDSLAQSAPPRH